MLHDCIEIMILSMPKLFWPKSFAMIKQHMRFGSFDELLDKVLIFCALPRAIEQASHGSVDDNVDGDFART